METKKSSSLTNVHILENSIFSFQILEDTKKMKIALFFAFMDFLPVIMTGQRCAVLCCGGGGGGEGAGGCMGRA